MFKVGNKNTVKIEYKKFAMHKKRINFFMSHKKGFFSDM